MGYGVSDCTISINTLLQPATWCIHSTGAGKGLLVRSKKNNDWKRIGESSTGTMLHILSLNKGDLGFEFEANLRKMFPVHRLS